MQSAHECRLLLQACMQERYIRPLDEALAQFFLEQDEQAPMAALLAALLSRQLADGHVCQSLDALRQLLASFSWNQDSHAKAWQIGQSWLNLTAAQWRDQLLLSVLVTTTPEQRPAPLVLQQERVYLYRYWYYETAVAQQIAVRLRHDLPLTSHFPEQLRQLFPADGQEGTDWQKVACAMAASGRFTLITGGPGTGKTTTVVRLLALLQQQAEQPLHICLAAPTGKAAARLTESISQHIAELNVPESVRQRIPAQVRTLHRLLGSLPNTRAFRHNAQNPLLLDVLVVDEASMIDLEMMHNLLQALPPQARLILLGDKDQLASVEAGAVLGELCLQAQHGLYHEQTFVRLEQLCGAPIDKQALQQGTQQHRIEQHTVMLRYSRRFSRDSGIGQLAEAVNTMDSRRVLNLLAEQPADVKYLSFSQPRQLNDLICQGFAPYMALLKAAPEPDADGQVLSQWAAELLHAFDGFRLLCALRGGFFGVEALNAQAESCLQLADGNPWYVGRPVMVVRNEYSLGLMNGDIGICVALLNEQGERTLRVAFPRSDGGSGVRFVLTSRLTAVETVYAMTVHKSQGSEFIHAALVMPDTFAPVLTKELLYTGITRAKQRLTLAVASEAVLYAAIRQQVRRSSGLRAALQTE